MIEGHKVYWFSGSLFPVGIVKTPSGNVYIGAAQGINEDDDTLFIAKFGNKIDLHDVIKKLEIPEPGTKKECVKEI